MSLKTLRASSNLMPWLRRFDSYLTSSHSNIYSIFPLSARFKGISNCSHLLESALKYASSIHASISKKQERNSPCGAVRRSTPHWACRPRRRFPHQADTPRRCRPTRRPSQIKSRVCSWFRHSLSSPLTAGKTLYTLHRIIRKFRKKPVQLHHFIGDTPPPNFAPVRS